MDASGETASMTAEEESEVQHLTQEEDLELALANLTVEGELTSCQCLPAAHFNKEEYLEWIVA